MFHDVGVGVTVLEYLPQIVPLEDAEVSKVVERSFTKRGITVMTNARFDAAEVKTGKDGVTPDRSGRRARTPPSCGAEQMLVATGRAANIEDIGLETTRVETDRGIIKVDGHMRTREPHVYAIGDIVGGLWLAHTAGHEGITAAHVIAGEADVHPMDYNAQPRATYCRPEIASIGLTEEQVKAAGTPYKVGKVPFQAIAKALIGGEYEGFAKVIGATDSGDTLGVHIVGPHATDLIAEASLGFRLDADAVGDRRAPPTPTRPCPRSSARRPWRSTGGPSTSSGDAPGGRSRTRWPPPRDQRRQPRRLGRPDRRRPASRCTATSRWPARSTSGCGSSTGPGASRSSSPARATRAPRSASPGRSSAATTGSPRSTARSRPA